ncbi:hypothetical protein ABT218_10135 [Streptomyces sp. NPDC001455]
MLPSLAHATGRPGVEPPARPPADRPLRNTHRAQRPLGHPE